MASARADARSARHPLAHARTAQAFFGKVERNAWRAMALHRFVVVDLPVNATVEPAQPVLLRELAQAGPAPGDAAQLRPQHQIGRAARERDIVAPDNQRDRLRARGGERRMARRVGGELRGGDVASPIGLRDHPRIGVRKRRRAHPNRALRAHDVVMGLAVPHENRRIALRHADEREGAGQIDKVEAAILQQLRADMDHVSRRRDPPRAVFPEQRDLRLIGGSHRAVGAAEAPDGAELLGEFGACRIVELAHPKLRAARHRPRRDLPVPRKQAAFERSERRAGPRAVERSRGAPPQRIGAPFVAPR